MAKPKTKTEEIDPLELTDTDVEEVKAKKPLTDKQIIAQYEAGKLEPKMLLEIKNAELRNQTLTRLSDPTTTTDPKQRIFVIRKGNGIEVFRWGASINDVELQNTIRVMRDRLGKAVSSMPFVELVKPYNELNTIHQRIEAQKKKAVAATRKRFVPPTSIDL